MKKIHLVLALVSTLVCLPSSAANIDSLFASIKDDIPKRQFGEGQYDQLIIRGAYLIDGSGAPATGPVDIVVERDRFTEVRSVGTPSIAIDPTNRPELMGYQN